jgi:hypothetical protein
MKFAKTDADGGTFFVSVDPLRNGSARKGHALQRALKPTNDTRPNLDALAERFHSALTLARRNELATALGVTAASLEALSVGWATVDDLRAMKAGGAGWAENWPEGAFAFPERDGGGRLVGFSFRATDGRKGGPASATGAKRGLLIPATIHEAGEPVLIVEGASDVAACVVLSLAAVGRPSNAGGAEHLTKLLKNQNVLVVGENDAKPTGAWPGRDGAERVATRLATSRGEPVSWVLPPSSAKDVRAWLLDRVAGGLELTNADACREAGRALLTALRADADEAKPEKGPSVAEQLVRLALETFRFGRTDKDEPFAVAHDGANVAIMLKGSGDALRAKLARNYRAMTSRTPGASALADALNVLTGEALDAEAEPVYLRLASHEGGVVIDLADADGRAVIVRPSGWEVVERSPVLFRRTVLTGGLPIPQRGGTLAELRELLNATDESWPLIAGFVIAAFLPNIPHPILLLSGLQGTGKSCAARVLVNLCDPSPAPLRSEPRDAEQWAIAAAGSWTVALDNLSYIPGWLSDALCKAATGDGIVKRKLYTDGDLAVLSFRRVVLLTSIDAGALRGDLGERLLLVDLEPIPEAERRTEEELESLFAGRKAHSLGALLDAVAAVLAKLPNVRPGRLPRMADFGRVLAAADMAGVTDGALDRFLGQQGRIAAEVIDADPFGAALSDFVRSRGEWEGTASELLAELHPDGTDKTPKGWPKRNNLTGRLKRLIPALAAQGITVSCGQREATPQRRRLIRLAVGKSAQNIVHNVQTPDLASAVVDEVDNLDDTPPTLSPVDADGTVSWDDCIDPMTLETNAPESPRAGAKADQ